jgi:hypothetical protein
MTYFGGVFFNTYLHDGVLQYFLNFYFIFFNLKNIFLKYFENIPK